MIQFYALSKILHNTRPKRCCDQCINSKFRLTILHLQLPLHIPMLSRSLSNHFPLIFLLLHKMFNNWHPLWSFNRNLCWKVNEILNGHRDELRIFPLFLGVDTINYCSQIIFNILILGYGMSKEMFVQVITINTFCN